MPRGSLWRPGATPSADTTEQPQRAGHLDTSTAVGPTPGGTGPPTNPIRGAAGPQRRIRGPGPWALLDGQPAGNRTGIQYWMRMLRPAVLVRIGGMANPSHTSSGSGDPSGSALLSMTQTLERPRCAQSGTPGASTVTCSRRSARCSPQGRTCRLPRCGHCPEQPPPSAVLGPLDGRRPRRRKLDPGAGATAHNAIPRSSAVTTTSAMRSTNSYSARR